MKLLILSSVPPCKSSTGGLVLDRVCRLLPQGSAASFVVAGYNPDARLSADLDWMSVQYRISPRQRVPYLHSELLTNAFSIVMDIWNKASAIEKLTREIVAFGKDFGADRLWCTLEGQTLIRLAIPVSSRLGVPLITHICDPPYWWMRSNRIDPISQRSILRCYEGAIRQSDCCAAASLAMAEDYRRAYGIKAVPLLPSLDGKIARNPAKAITNSNHLIIGLAGKIYALNEWEALLHALDTVSWRIGGRDVIIRLLSREIPVVNRGVRFEFYGWQSEADTIRILSEVDVCYCPYWFDKLFEQEARYGFPGKLTTYLASGRPVLFHGPSYASPARFIEENKAGLCCYSNDPKDIIATLESLIYQPALYAELTACGSKAFREHLTFEKYRQACGEILNAEKGFFD